MPNKEISSEQEAQELLAQLERLYRQPVLPLHKFCAAIELWMDCIVKSNTDPALIDKVRCCRRVCTPVFSVLASDQNRYTQVQSAG
jgi:hypothetical protein